MLDNPELAANLWSGAPKDLAKRFNCDVNVVYKLRKRLGKKKKDTEQPAPSQLDDRMSKESLMPSPWVMARIAEIRGIV